MAAVGVGLFDVRCRIQRSTSMAKSVNNQVSAVFISTRTGVARPTTIASCELVVPLGQTDFAALTVYLSYVGPPPIDADQVTVSFRVADEDDE